MRSQIPNILTIIRFLLIFPIVGLMISGRFQLAFYLFVIAGITDGVDGYLARRFDWISRFGSIADPLADKFLLVSSFIVLTYLGHIPGLLLSVVIGRDLLILLGALVLHWLIGRYDFVPSRISKINTLLQNSLIVVVLFQLGFAATVPYWLMGSLMVIVFITSIISFLDYGWVWIKRVRDATTAKR